MKDDKIELNAESLDKHLKIFDDVEKSLQSKYERIEDLKNFLLNEDKKIKYVPYNSSVINDLKVSSKHLLFRPIFEELGRFEK